MRIILIVLLVLGAGGYYLFDLDQFMTLEALREHRFMLNRLVQEHAVLAVILYIATYAASMAFVLPVSLVLTVAGGFLFGIWLGTLYAVVGATAGAVAVFLIAKTALGEVLRSRAGPALERMEAGFREDALNYLLVLRLIPISPFFLVNIVPAFLGVDLRTYVIGTAFGIVPGVFVYATVGAGLGDIFVSMTENSLSAALTPAVVAALIGLSVLALLPVAYKKFKARRSGDNHSP